MSARTTQLLSSGEFCKLRYDTHLLKVNLQTFLSLPITQKCQILICDTLVANERYVSCLCAYMYACVVSSQIRRNYQQFFSGTKRFSTRLQMIMRCMTSQKIHSQQELIYFRAIYTYTVTEINFIWTVLHHSHGRNFMLWTSTTTVQFSVKIPNAGWMTQSFILQETTTLLRNHDVRPDFETRKAITKGRLKRDKS